MHAILPLVVALQYGVLADQDTVDRVKRQFYGWPCPCNNPSKRCCTRPEYTNPCFVGRPILSPNGVPQFCGNDASSCPSNYFCHFGAQRSTTCCCQQLSNNPCTQPLNVGRGDSRLQRWYFNAQSGQCESFMYYGLAGNQNNYLTQAQCRQLCNVKDPPVNPCAVGVPPQDAQGEPMRCGNSQVCPPQYWCHVGVEPKTTVCCPRTSDECSAPESGGIGGGQLQRWWFNPNTKECQPFLYRGQKGNENNYLSREQCKATCIKYINACIQGQPLLIGSGQAQSCSRMQGCPVAYWCHVGASTDTTMCCPDVGDPCTLAQYPGTGAAQIRRWYYDVNSKSCSSFVYAGIKGNSNNFLTQEECEKTCPVWENVCSQGEPMIQNGKPHYCSPQNLCPPNYYCHIGRDQSHTMCCQSTGDPCRLPLQQGFGNDNLPRYYYEVSTRQCKTFTYKGMKGNENNFLSKSDCTTVCPEVNPCQAPGQPLQQTGLVATCEPMNLNSCPGTHFCHPGSTQADKVCCPNNGDRCSLPHVAGQGNLNLRRWYYSMALDECVQFGYRGAGGGPNNFIDQNTCEQACPGMRGFCPHGRPLEVMGQPQTCSVESLCQNNYVCHVNTRRGMSVCCPDPTNFCFLPVDVGTCNERMERFHYDPASDTCVSFVWSGCGGNLNNFPTHASCTKLCCKEQDTQNMAVPIDPNFRFPNKRKSKSK